MILWFKNTIKMLPWCIHCLIPVAVYDLPVQPNLLQPRQPQRQPLSLFSDSQPERKTRHAHLLWLGSCNFKIELIKLTLHGLLQLRCTVERHWFNSKFSVEVVSRNCFAMVTKVMWNIFTCKAKLALLEALKYMLTPESRCIPVLGWVILCIRALPNC